MFCVSLFSVKEFLIYKFKQLSFLKRLYNMSSTTYIHDPLPVTPFMHQIFRYQIIKSCYKYLTKFISPYIIYLLRFIVKNDIIRAKHW